MTNTFREHLQRAIFETFDLWDIWSGRWENMTWPAKRQRRRQALWQCQRQWQILEYLEFLEYLELEQFRNFCEFYCSARRGRHFLRNVLRTSGIVQLWSSKKPTGLFQCKFCGSCFDTFRGRTIHLNTCSEKPAIVPSLNVSFVEKLLSSTGRKLCISTFVLQNQSQWHDVCIVCNHDYSRLEMN